MKINITANKNKTTTIKNKRYEDTLITKQKLTGWIVE